MMLRWKREINNKISGRRLDIKDCNIRDVALSVALQLRDEESDLASNPIYNEVSCLDFAEFRGSEISILNFPMIIILIK